MCNIYLLSTEKVSMVLFRLLYIRPKNHILTSTKRKNITSSQTSYIKTRIRREHSRKRLITKSLWSLLEILKNVPKESKTVEDWRKAKMLKNHETIITIWYQRLMFWRKHWHESFIGFFNPKGEKPANKYFILNKFSGNSYFAEQRNWNLSRNQRTSIIQGYKISFTHEETQHKTRY